jgi:hypothetical protein
MEQSADQLDQFVVNGNTEREHSSISDDAAQKGLITFW